MAQKRQQSTYTVSLTLKTAMQAQSVYPEIGADMAVFDGSENDQHLLHGQWQDGAFRTVNVTPSGTTFDFVNPSDSALVRIWTEREIYEQIGFFPGVSFSQGVQQGQTWTHTIRHSGIDYTGQSNNKVDAMCIAFTNLLNAQ